LGASMLFITNAAAIILGAAAVFRLLGMTGYSKHFGRPLWIRRVLLLLAMACIILIVPLSRNLAARLAEGEDRALILPASKTIRNEIHARIARESDVELYYIIRSGHIHDKLIRVTLISAKPLGDTLAQDINRIIRERMGKNMTIEIVVMKAEVRKSHPVSD
jgi:hypothetical protein